MSQGEMQPWLIEALTTHRDPPTPTSSMSRHPSVAGDDPWSWVRDNVEWADVLDRNGWTQMRGGYWCRPGKNPRDGHSAQLHDDGRFAIWTGEVPNEIRDLGTRQSDGGVSISLADFICAYEHGGDRQAFGREYRAKMPPPVPSVAAGRTEETDGEAKGSEPAVAGSWSTAVDLTAALNGTEILEPPSILRRHDGIGLFYPASINGIHGESGIGKGWVVLTACAEQLRLGNKVIYLDMEDTAVSIISRLKTIGVTTGEILDNLLYYRPTEESSPVEIQRLVTTCIEQEVVLVILDSLGEAFGLDSISENNDDEVSPWMRQVPRRLAEAGACVIIVDHSTKANDNPLYPSGSKRKRAVVGGAAYFVEALQALAQGKGGKLRLTCAKDRHGFHRRATTAAEMVFTPSGPDEMIVRTFAPHGMDDMPSAEEKTQAKVMDAAIELEKLAKLRRKPFSKSSLTDSLAGMRADAKRAGFEWLLIQGRLVEAGRNLYEVPRS